MGRGRSAAAERIPATMRATKSSTEPRTTRHDDGTVEFLPVQPVWFHNQDDGTEESRRRRSAELCTRHVSYEYVEDMAAVERMLARLAEFPQQPIALDFETAMRGYAHRRDLVRYGDVRLVQIGWVDPMTGFGQQWLVDVHRVPAESLRAIMNDRAREKLIHYSRFEQEFAHTRLRTSIFPVYDTVIAWQSVQRQLKNLELLRGRFEMLPRFDERAVDETVRELVGKGKRWEWDRLLGGCVGERRLSARQAADLGRHAMNEAIEARVEALMPGWDGHHSGSMAMLSERVCGLHVDKGEQTSDWGAPVLSDEQRTYAALDVVVPFILAERLRTASAALEIDGKINWRTGKERGEAIARWPQARLDEFDESRDLAWAMLYAPDETALRAVGMRARQGIMPDEEREGLREVYAYAREQLLAGSTA